MFQELTFRGMCVGRCFMECIVFLWVGGVGWGGPLSVSRHLINHHPAAHPNWGVFEWCCPSLKWPQFQTALKHLYWLDFPTQCDITRPVLCQFWNTVSAIREDLGRRQVQRKIPCQCLIWLISLCWRYTVTGSFYYGNYYNTLQSCYYCKYLCGSLSVLNASNVTWILGKSQWHHLE